MINVVEQQLDTAAELRRRVGALRLEIFACAVRHEFYLMTSDLDFLVEFDELPPARYAHAYFIRKESLEALFGRQIYLIAEASLENPYYCAGVQAERQTVYAR